MHYPPCVPIPQSGSAGLVIAFSYVKLPLHPIRSPAGAGSRVLQWGREVRPYGECWIATGGTAPDYSGSGAHLPAPRGPRVARTPGGEHTAPVTSRTGPGGSPPPWGGVYSGRSASAHLFPLRRLMPSSIVGVAWTVHDTCPADTRPPPVASRTAPSTSQGRGRLRVRASEGEYKRRSSSGQGGRSKFFLPPSTGCDQIRPPRWSILGRS